MLGLHFCARAFSSCGKRGPLFIALRGPLTVPASPIAEHRLQTRRLSNCGARAQLLRGTWDLPRPGLEPVSPALACRFSTTAAPGKPSRVFCIDKKYRNIEKRYRAKYRSLGKVLQMVFQVQCDLTKYILYLLLPQGFILGPAGGLSSRGAKSPGRLLMDSTAARCRKGTD